MKRLFFGFLLLTACVEQELPPQERNIDVYPNPAREVVHVRVQNLTAPSTLKIVDPEGRVIHSEPVFDEAAISLQDSPDGKYFAILLEGSKVVQKTFLKRSK